MGWSIGIELNGIPLGNSSWNYTHNCNDMMRFSGFDWIYNLGGQKVIDTIPKFQEMLKNLKSDPEKYRAMNPVNGWGDYDSLVDMWENEILPEAIEISSKIPECTWWESS